MWRMDYKPATLAWILGAALAVGIGFRIVEGVRGKDTEFPGIVVQRDAEVLAIKARADSIISERRAKENGPIAINSASAADFETLDGIGKVLAARIVAYRDAHGPFASVEDLTNVSGIGPKRLDAIRARCVLDTLSR